MNDKDKKIIEKMIEKKLLDILDNYENPIDSYQEDYIIPIKVIKVIEKYLGKTITFMGIS